jgi:hypothetical protein
MPDESIAEEGGLGLQFQRSSARVVPKAAYALLAAAVCACVTLALNEAADHISAFLFSFDLLLGLGHWCRASSLEHGGEQAPARLRHKHATLDHTEQQVLTFA